MSSKRFVPIAEYSRQTGLSYPTIKNALETGQLAGVKTGSGNWKIDTQAGQDVEVSVLIDKLNVQTALLERLCAHLGVAMQGVNV